VRSPLLALLLPAVLLLTLPPASQAMSADELMVHEINKFRAAHGLPRVHLSNSLSRGSRSYARRLIARNDFRHARNIGAGGRFSSLGEVLEMHTGQRAKVRFALRAWKNSPGHRAVLLHRGFHLVGAGFHTGTWRGMRATIWVGRFGLRRK